MPSYRFVRDYNMSGLEYKAGDSVELEVEDAMDLPVVPEAEYVPPKKKEPKKEAKKESEKKAK